MEEENEILEVILGRKTSTKDFDEANIRNSMNDCVTGHLKYDHGVSPVRGKFENRGHVYQFGGDDNVENLKSGYEHESDKDDILEAENDKSSQNEIGPPIGHLKRQPSNERGTKGVNTKGTNNYFDVSGKQKSRVSADVDLFDSNRVDINTCRSIAFGNVSNRAVTGELTRQMHSFAGDSKSWTKLVPHVESQDENPLATKYTNEAPLKPSKPPSQSNEAASLMSPVSPPIPTIAAKIAAAKTSSVSSSVYKKSIAPPDPISSLPSHIYDTLPLLRIKNGPKDFETLLEEKLGNGGKMADAAQKSAALHVNVTTGEADGFGSSASNTPAVKPKGSTFLRKGSKKASTLVRNGNLGDKNTHSPIQPPNPPSNKAAIANERSSATTPGSKGVSPMGRRRANLADLSPVSNNNMRRTATKVKENVSPGGAIGSSRKAITKSGAKGQLAGGRTVVNVASEGRSNGGEGRSNGGEEATKERHITNRNHSLPHNNLQRREKINNDNLQGRRSEDLERKKTDFEFGSDDEYHGQNFEERGKKVVNKVGSRSVTDRREMLKNGEDETTKYEEGRGEDDFDVADGEDERELQDANGEHEDLLEALIGEFDAAMNVAATMSGRPGRMSFSEEFSGAEEEEDEDEELEKIEKVVDALRGSPARGSGDVDGVNGGDCFGNDNHGEVYYGRTEAQEGQHNADRVNNNMRSEGGKEVEEEIVNLNEFDGMEDDDAVSECFTAAAGELLTPSRSRQSETRNSESHDSEVFEEKGKVVCKELTGIKGVTMRGIRGSGINGKEVSVVGKGRGKRSVNSGNSHPRSPVAFGRSVKSSGTPQSMADKSPKALNSRSATKPFRAVKSATASTRRATRSSEKIAHTSKPLSDFIGGPDGVLRGQKVVFGREGVVSRKATRDRWRSSDEESYGGLYSDKCETNNYRDPADREYQMLRRVEHDIEMRRVQLEDEISKFEFDKSNYLADAQKEWRGIIENLEVENRKTLRQNNRLKHELEELSQSLLERQEMVEEVNFLQEKLETFEDDRREELKRHQRTVAHLNCKISDLQNENVKLSAMSSVQQSAPLTSAMRPSSTISSPRASLSKSWAPSRGKKEVPWHSQLRGYSSPNNGSGVRSPASHRQTLPLNSTHRRWGAASHFQKSISHDVSPSSRVRSPTTVGNTHNSKTINHKRSMTAKCVPSTPKSPAVRIRGRGGYASCRAVVTPGMNSGFGRQSIQSKINRGPQSDEEMANGILKRSGANGESLYGGVSEDITGLSMSDRVAEIVMKQNYENTGSSLGVPPTTNTTEMLKPYNGRGLNATFPTTYKMSQQPSFAAATDGPLFTVANESAMRNVDSGTAETHFREGSNDSTANFNSQVFGQYDILRIEDFADVTSFDHVKIWTPLGMLLSCTSRVVSSTQSLLPNGAKEELFADGHRELTLTNGLRKTMYPSGWTVLFYSNGDVKATQPDGSVLYHFQGSGIYQYTNTDGTVFTRFSNGQVEKRCGSSGEIKIVFSDGSLKRISPDGSELARYPDGSQRWLPPSTTK